MGDFPDATAVYDTDSMGILRLVSASIAASIPAASRSAARRTFLCATGAEPAAARLQREVERLRQKRDAGAELVMTQPVYDPEVLDRMLRAIEPLGIPVLVGLLPLASYRNAEFLHNEVPGMQIPEHIRERMRKARLGRSRARTRASPSRARCWPQVKDRVAGRVRDAAVRSSRAGAEGDRGHRRDESGHVHWRVGVRSDCSSSCTTTGKCPAQLLTDPARALATQQARSAQLRTLRAEAKVDQRGREGRIKGRVMMFVERPDRVRFDAVTQFGPALTLTSDGEQFALSDFKSNRFLAWTRLRAQHCPHDRRGAVGTRRGQRDDGREPAARRELFQHGLSGR